MKLSELGFMGFMGFMGLSGFLHALNNVETGRIFVGTGGNPMNPSSDMLLGTLSK